MCLGLPRGLPTDCVFVLVAGHRGGARGCLSETVCAHGDVYLIPTHLIEEMRGWCNSWSIAQCSAYCEVGLGRPIRVHFACWRKVPH